MSLTRVLVTGGTGFLGTEVVEALADTQRYEITVVDINPPALGTGSISDVRYVRANVLQPDELGKVFHEAKPVIVVHTVGMYHVGTARYSSKGKEALFKLNVDGTRNVIAAAKECGARGLVFTSSVTVLIDELGKDFRNADETWPTGRATLSYGQSKTAAENLVLAANSSDFQTCSLRSATIFGPRDAAVIPLMHELIARGETRFKIGDGTNLVDWVYVSNVADAHILAVNNLLSSGTAAGEAFFITNGEPLAIRDFCIALWSQFGHVPTFEVKIPVGLGWWLGWAMEWISWATGTEATLCRGVMLDASAERYLNISKARRVLGYNPRVGMEDGLRLSCQDYKEKLEGRSKN